MSSTSTVSPRIVNPVDLQREEDARLVQPAEAEQTFHLSLMLRTLRKGMSTIVRFTVVALVLGILFAFFFLPLKYTATTSFLPPGSDVSGTSSMASRLASLGGLGAGLLGGAKSPGDLYGALLRSQTVTTRMIDMFNLKTVYGTKLTSRAAKALEGSTAVTIDSKDPVVTISVTDTSPKRAQDMANGYLTVLQEVTANLSLTENSQRRSFYEKRLEQEKTALADAEVALKQTQETTGIISLAGQTASGIQEAAQLRAQVAAHQVQLAALLQSETEENPEVKRVRQELGSLLAQIAQMEKSQTGGPVGAPSNVQVPALELEYVRKLREVKYHETLFDILAKQYEAARLDEAQDAPLQILDRATLPDVKSGPPRLLLTLVVTLLGLLAGMTVVLLRPQMARLRG